MITNAAVGIVFAKETNGDMNRLKFLNKPPIVPKIIPSKNEIVNPISKRASVHPMAEYVVAA
jgi:hypothetical protein